MIRRNYPLEQVAGVVCGKRCRTRSKKQKSVEHQRRDGGRYPLGKHQLDRVYGLWTEHILGSGVYRGLNARSKTCIVHRFGQRDCARGEAMRPRGFLGSYNWRCEHRLGGCDDTATIPSCRRPDRNLNARLDRGGGPEHLLFECQNGAGHKRGGLDGIHFRREGGAGARSEKTGQPVRSARLALVVQFARFRLTAMKECRADENDKERGRMEEHIAILRLRFRNGEEVSGYQLANKSAKVRPSSGLLGAKAVNNEFVTKASEMHNDLARLGAAE